MVEPTACDAANLAYLAALEAAAPPAPALPAVSAAAEPAEAEGSGLPITHCDTRQVRVLQLINAYRFHGFRVADVDPLLLHPISSVQELEFDRKGLRHTDLDIEFETGSLAGPPRDTLRNIISRLRAAYCGTLSAEYMYLSSTEQKRWLQRRFEAGDGLPEIDNARRRWLLDQLTRAEVLEKLIHARYVGQKRFSLEGAEALVPLLNILLELAAGAGIQEVGLGMAHRGRLNVLHNVLGRSATAFFDREDLAAPEGASNGDVKYHQGFAREVETLAGPIRLALAFNPSHLEVVGPVVQGWVRAQQQKRGDHDGSLVMPVLVHGDAAFVGQGVVMETLNMSATRGFTTGGTIHIVVNNQIGFTTSDPRDTRSSLYCTDGMKMVEAPVLHVNGDDPEAVMRAVKIAFDYRMAFHRDVAIDLVCYRRLGHNEQDEPMVTQPLMYRRIRDMERSRAQYAALLESWGEIGAGEADAMVESFRRSLDEAPSEAPRPYAPYVADWRPFRTQDWRAGEDTAMPLERLQELGRLVSTLPEGFAAHPRVIMVMGNRRQMAEGIQPLDWGMAETLAYAGLLTEGHGVRLTGQDSARGTFFHRHAVVHDQNRRMWDAGVHIPLCNLGPGQAHFLVVDSLLSEEAVLGFEYGYASTAPHELVIWEAQFGDFVNGAQVIIDQFVASAETKWGRLNGLVMFLPHGYEGQGPEHSSGRIERFLQLTAEDNIQVVQPSTAAQFFHLLRRQVLRPYRKPLVVFTPKSLLRHPDAASALSEFTAGGFRPVLGDATIEPERITRLVLCSGRIYYDLATHRRESGRRDIALARVEQFYPFPDRELAEELRRYPQLTELVWAQDEPRNQGAWRFMAHELRQLGAWVPQFAGRPASASPATGFHHLHEEQLRDLLHAAFG